MNDALPLPPSAAPATASRDAAERQIDLLNAEAWEIRRADAGRALALSEEAYALAAPLAYRRGEAYSLLARGFAEMRLSNYPAALGSAQQAAALFGALTDDAGRLKAMNLLGIVYGETSDFPAALTTFLAVCELCETMADGRGLADALNNVAAVYISQGDLARSPEYHLRSPELCREVAYHEGHVRSLNNLGVLYYELGRYSEAAAHLRRALELGEVAPDPHTYALTLGNLGRAYDKLKDYQEALRCHLQSLAIIETLGNEMSLGDALENLGLVYTKLDEAAALQYFTQSLAIKARIGDRKGLAEAGVYLGELLTRQDRLQEAVTVLQGALAEAQTVGSKLDSYRAHAALAQAYKRSGLFEGAFEQLERSTETKDEVFNEESDRRMHALRVGFELEQAEREREIYRLKNVELAGVVAKLEALTASLREADEQKSALLGELEKHAREDALTGLYNRRYVDERLAQELSRARRFGGTVSVALGDVDDFKRVNDTFSHATGDEVLKVVARLFRETCREVDTAARYGGEEFVLLLPETSAEHAAALCDKLRAVVAAHPWHLLHPDLSVTISFGVADTLNGDDLEALVRRADDKLYEAKRSGKNRVRY